MATEILDRCLADLARQIRNQQLVRAFCRLVLILVVLVAAFWLLDLFVSFSPAALRLATAVAAGVLVVGTSLGLGSAFRRLDPSALAALIEQKHPELGERLISIVDLEKNKDSGHGTPEFIACLRQETESRLAQVDVQRAFASARNRRLPMLAGAALVALILPALYWNLHGDFVRRFLSTSGPPDESGESTVVHPVRLADEPLVAITPPVYVRQDVHPPRKLVGPTDLSVLQYSAVAFQFRFDQPAMSGSVELKTTTRMLDVVPLQLSGDGLTGTFAVPALDPGVHSLALILEGKGRSISRIELPSLEIWPDEPPRFTEVLIKNVPGDSLTDRVWTMPPQDAIPVQVSVEDKVGVDKVNVEYRINDGPARIETMALGRGKASVTTDFLFRPAEKVQDGDILKFRLQAADNRKVVGKTYQDAAGRPAPNQNLGPQVVCYPTERWFRVKIERGAKTLPEQDILAQRQRINDKVQEVINKLKKERAGLMKVREEVDGTSPHQSSDWNGKVDKLRQINDAVRQDLHWLALDRAGDEVLQPLAALAWDIAEGELKASADGLDKAKVKTLAGERRDQHLQTADAELARALKRLEELVNSNQRLAEDRLDQRKLEKLARDQEILGNMAERDLTPQELAELQAGEDRLVEEMHGLTKGSKLVQETLEAAREEEMRKLEALVKTPEGRAVQKQFAPQLTALGKKQKDLAGKMSGLGLPPKDAEEAAKALELGQLHKAMQFQHSAMKKLEHLGKESLPKTTDSAKTMAQLSKEQKELNQSLKKIASAMADKLEFKMGANKSDPPNNQAKAGQAMKQAKKQLDDAVVKLKLGKIQQARPAMQQAARNLQQAAMQTKRHMTQSQQTGVPGTAKQNPGKSPPSPGGISKSGPLGPDLKKYSGAAWGQMPEQLRTRMLQELRAQFGEDYARIIQRYFERINEER